MAMAERILKRERTKQGEEYLVAAQQIVTELPSAARAPDAGKQEAAAEAAGQDTQQVEQLLAAAEQQAEHIAGRAEQAAEQLRQRAEDELRQLREAAAAELAQKRRALESEIRRELEGRYSERYAAAVAALEQAAKELRDHQEEYLAQIEQPALKLVLAVGRQLLGAELSRAPDFVATLIARALDVLKPRQVVKVMLNAETHQRLQDDELLADALRKAGVKPELVSVTVDETLAPGEFTAEVNGMSVEYSLEEVIAELTAQIEQRAATLAEGSGKERS